MAKALKKAKVNNAHIALNQVAGRKRALESYAECVNMFLETVDEGALQRDGSIREHSCCMWGATGRSGGFWQRLQGSKDGP